MSWFYRKKTVVATSTCETKYISLCVACKDTLWFQKLVGYIVGESTTIRTTLLFCYSASAINVSANESINRRNKHIDMIYHFVRATPK